MIQRYNHTTALPPNNQIVMTMLVNLVVDTTTEKKNKRISKADHISESHTSETLAQVVKCRWVVESPRFTGGSRQHNAYN